jgi:hypothetical protein
MSYKSTLSKAALVTVVAVALVLAVLRFDSFQVGAYSDDAHYIVLAKSLADGQGYRLINFPDAPAEWAFPPGWPLLLAPLVALFQGDLTILKVLPFTLWLASILLAYLLFCGIPDFISTPYQIILVGLVALNPAVVGVSHMMMSETAFLFFSLLTLWLMQKWNANAQRTSRDWLLVCVGLSAAYTQLIRTIGLALIAAIILYLLAQRRLRQVGIVAASIAVVALSQLWLNLGNGGSLISPGYESQVFGSGLVAKLAQAWDNFQTYLKEMISNSIVPAFGPNVTTLFDGLSLGWLPVVANVLILAVVTIGFIVSIRYMKEPVLHACMHT